MGKVVTSIKVDEELRDKAKKAGVNMSEVIETALRGVVEGTGDRRPELPNMCSCGHGRTRHVSVDGRGVKNVFVIYKCYECQRWCTTGSLENKGPYVEAQP